MTERNQYHGKPQTRLGDSRNLLRTSILLQDKEDDQEEEEADQGRDPGHSEARLGGPQPRRGRRASQGRGRAGTKFNSDFYVLGFG